MKEILCITTYPPRECGIATFSYDLIRTMDRKFGQNCIMKVCAVESDLEKHTYDNTVKYTLNSSVKDDFHTVAEKINEDTDIQLVCIQHEFGLFNENKELFLQFVETMTKPVVIVFHTVLANPEPALQIYLQKLIDLCSAVVVMTRNSADILHRKYLTEKDKITIIPHGTHLISQKNKKTLKEKYGFADRKILSTFGLLSPGKSIETTLDALPAIIINNPSVLFLIIGKTHPSIAKTEGEAYREELKARIEELHLADHVQFINFYLDLPILLEYLQMTDIYVFTSSDPNQAVSGTFVYALSCGCPIIATPIPHALELLQDNTGIIFDFHDSTGLSKAANGLFANEKLRAHMGMAGMQKTAFTAWENSAIAYALLFRKIAKCEEALSYSLPAVNLTHIKRMSQNFGIIQFSKGNRPDIDSGYTLDDNARALIALCQAYISNQDMTCAKYIKRYLKFIHYCLENNGSFQNYVDKARQFTSQNNEAPLEDSNGRAVWALGYFISHGDNFVDSWTRESINAFKSIFPMLHDMQSPRSMAFALKGLYYLYRKDPSQEAYGLIMKLAGKLVKLFQSSADKEWRWFEPYLTYDNCVLPESLIYAYQISGDDTHKETAEESFRFLLKKTFVNGQIKVISNRGWLQKDGEHQLYGEQPVDVAGTVIALGTFYRCFREPEYLQKQKEAFSWFLGNNHLNQIIYNPATGGCYDGLEENNINLNQGAESSLCYLMARLSLI